MYKLSEDEGRTWGDLKILYSNSSNDEVNVIGNAAPVLDTSNGRLHLPFCRNNEEVWYTYSDDSGQSWAPVQYMPHLVHSDWKWVGLGPPAGLQLTSGRLLIPSYHTTLIKGDGCLSVGHTLYSDDHGITWQIGSASFGSPFLSNECQAVQLSNGSVLINARTVSTHRIQIMSDDGGLSFGQPVLVPTLQQTIEGCEGSIVRDPNTALLYFSNPNSDMVIRRNMTVFVSSNEGSSWEVLANADRGAVSYSALQYLPGSKGLGLLYERSDEMKIVFEPDEIVFWKVF